MAREEKADEAFRALLGRLHPERPDLPATIASYRWFDHYGDPYGASRRDWRRAKLALMLIRKAQRHGRLRAYHFVDNLLTPIHETEVASGELSIFERTLRCAAGRSYRDVLLSLDDALALAPGARGGRYAKSDAPLIDEARRLVAGGTSLKAAADAVADRAAGGGTYESRSKRIARQLSRAP